MKSFAVAILFATLAVVGSGCRIIGDLFYTYDQPPTLEDSQVQDEYRIGAGDKLKVTVWGQDDLDAVVPVRPDGMISVPLLDDVQAAGLTALELKALLTQMLEEYVTAPDVTVTIYEMSSKLVYVTGEVVKSTAVQLDRELRVLDAITMAGGFTPYSDKRRIKIIRYKNGVMQEFRFNYKKFIAGKAPQSNIVLKPGDTIVVTE